MKKKKKLVNLNELVNSKITKIHAKLADSLDTDIKFAFKSKFILPLRQARNQIYNEVMENMEESKLWKI